MMKKICVIGAGVSGLAAGRLLSKKHDVTVYEQALDIGGIAKTKAVDGVAYHLVGGHCFNSKNQQVLDFVFDEVLAKDKWHQVKREAKINFAGHIISYPIEFAVREIAKFDESLASKITKDFLAAEDKKTDNLADWFRQKFGNTLAEKYFIPYNRKIWQMEPEKMSHLWVEGKLPLPNKDEFLKALKGKNDDKMVHNTFFYPNSNNQNTFIEALAEGVDIETDFKVRSIEKNTTKWLINGQFEYDLVISTMPLNVLPNVLKNPPNDCIQAAKKLKYNKVSTMFWQTDPVDFTWSYYPDSDTIFHRHIHIGNFHIPQQNYTITESIGEHSWQEMAEHGRKFAYLKKPLAHNISDYAYIVSDQNYQKSTATIKNYLNKIGLYSIGRFGEWEYFNMDICIESAMKIAAEIG